VSPAQVSSLFTARECEELGEKSGDKEEGLFAEGGFGKAADEVAGRERKPGVYDLGQFTAKG
jgi:hypothetical protein